jgi:hypothetical protein
MARFAAKLSLCLLVSSFVFAQTDPAAGIPPFSTQVGGTYDLVNPATGNILLTIPVRSKIGKTPFSIKLVGNSHASVTTNGAGKAQWFVSTGGLP